MQIKTPGKKLEDFYSWMPAFAGMTSTQNRRKEAAGAISPRSGAPWNV